MNLSNAGIAISDNCITNVTEQGIWLLVNKKEYFIPFVDYPMVKNIPVKKVFDVKIFQQEHISWEEFDIDIELSSLMNPENYPQLFH